MKGFSLIEVIIGMGLSIIIVIIVVTHSTHTVRVSKKIISHNEKLESLFHTMEMLRSDLTKCGMRLHVPSQIFGIPLFVNAESSFRVTYGIACETLLVPAQTGAYVISVNRNDSLQGGKSIIIYNPENQVYEFNSITGRNGEVLKLKDELLNDYPQHSPVVALKEVEYKLYHSQFMLKRKVNKGTFQPLIEDVTAFDVHFYPEANSVYYRLEINRKEQLRGYIFLSNMLPE